MYRLLFSLTLILTLALTGCSIQPLSSLSPDRSEGDRPGAPLLSNLGDRSHPITTQSPQAQLYFDQGLMLAFGFNHAESARSFREASRLDPSCAMCQWGLAYVLGPNINAPMAEDAVSEAYQAMAKARELAPQSSPQEQAYIEALAKRYVDQPPEDRTPLDEAYATAMEQVAQTYPQDLDASVLYAEALMDTMPWDYWTEEGQPKPKTQKVLDSLDSVLEQDPNHPQANHLYIHAVEAVHPEWGIAAADRLGPLVPGAGHLVHMPSHIYIRVGRYHDAAMANQQAIAVDQDYITQCHAQGLYPLAYMPHNHHFLWYSNLMEGQSQAALEAARAVAKMADPAAMREPGMGALQHYSSIPLYTMTRFGRWSEILAEPAPAEDLHYPTGVWHYARGMAFVAQGELTQAQQELQQLRAIAADPELQQVTIWELNSAPALLNIATEVLAGQIEAKQGDLAGAIAHFQTGVDLEEALTYNEPSDWYYSVRQSLGAAQLAANRPKDAAATYQADLNFYPENGWSLYGLWQSLQTQGDKAAAQAAQTRFETAWQYADIPAENLSSGDIL